MTDTGVLSEQECFFISHSLSYVLPLEPHTFLIVRRHVYEQIHLATPSIALHLEFIGEVHSWFVQGSVRKAKIFIKLAQDARPYCKPHESENDGDDDSEVHLWMAQGSSRKKKIFTLQDARPYCKPHESENDGDDDSEVQLWMAQGSSRKEKIFTLQDARPYCKPHESENDGDDDSEVQLWMAQGSSRREKIFTLQDARPYCKPYESENDGDDDSEVQLWMAQGSAKREKIFTLQDARPYCKPHESANDGDDDSDDYDDAVNQEWWTSIALELDRSLESRLGSLMIWNRSQISEELCWSCTNFKQRNNTQEIGTWYEKI